MRKYFTLFAFAAFLFAACSDDDLVQDYTPAEVGDEIVFGGSSYFESAQQPSKKEGRTVYGDKIDKKEEGIHVTEIKWAEGDKIRILCPQSREIPAMEDGTAETGGFVHFSDYEVVDCIKRPIKDKNDSLIYPGQKPTDGTYQEGDTTTLKRVAGTEMGLQWGSQEKHDFYAVYPSPSMFEPGSMEHDSYQLDNGIFHGFLPSSQAALGVGSGQGGNGGNYIIYPAMRYAYMMASAEGVTPTAEGVNLNFKPIVTAVEITLQNKNDKVTENDPDALDIKDISMVRVSSDKQICGHFDYDFKKKTYALTQPDPDAPQTYATQMFDPKTVTVPIHHGANGEPITLKKNEKLTFTVFLLPEADLTNLTVTIMAGTTFKQATLNQAALGPEANEDFKIIVQKKNFLKNVPLKFEGQASNWMAYIPDKTPLYNLSIPGATNAYSADIFATNANMADQKLDVNALWNKGVRCFEFWTNHNGTELFTGKGKDLDGAKVVVGDQEMSHTFGDAISEVWTKVKDNPREFAIVVLGFQPKDNGNRNAAAWAQGFNKYWLRHLSIDDATTTIKSLEGAPIAHSRKVRYNPSIQMKDARGKLFVVVRCTSVGADGWWRSFNLDDVANQQAHMNEFLAVAGWGSLTDQWYQRGFYDAASRPFAAVHVSGSGTATVTEEQKAEAINNLKKIYEGNLGNVSYYPGGKDATKKFVYPVLNSSEGVATDLEVYAQDWRRVAKENMTINYGSTTGYHKYQYFWPKSIDYKLKDISAAFAKAKGMTLEERQKTIVFNSLSGFYIDRTVGYSYWPIQYYVSTDKTKGDGTGADGLSAGQNPFLKYNDDLIYSDFGGYAGNIAEFAADINKKQYLDILQMGAQNINYPLGIIMMSRITNKIEKDVNGKPINPGGYYIPHVIVANNFKF